MGLAEISDRSPRDDRQSSPIRPPAGGWLFAKARPGYRPDIDGLRCIAVGGVVLYHMSAALLPGGFLGVDVFFVISGYLITAILLREQEEGRFSIANFYKRRVRRIFPALALVLLATLAAGWWLLDRYAYQELGKHTALGTAFVANVGYWLESNYFAPGALSKPLLHLWSLGVEEQFYLVWPILIAAVARWRWSAAWTLGTVAGCSFLYCLALSWTDPNAAFYSPLSRCWQLAAGGLVAVQLLRGKALPAANSFAATGLALIAASFLLVNDRALAPAPWAALPVAGAALLIWAGPNTIVARLLSLRPAVGMGLISYPLYLWHWPLLALAAYSNGFRPLNGATVVGLMLLAILLSVLTYVLVETPARRLRPLVLVAVLGSVGGCGLAIYAFGGVPSRAANEGGRDLIARYRQLHERGLSKVYREECDFLVWSRFAVKDRIADECTEAGERGTMLLWGDSHAQALSLGLRELLPSGVSLAQVATSGCAPRLPRPDQRRFEASNPAQRACERSNLTALETVRRLRPQVVFLTQAGFGEANDWDRFAAVLRRLGAHQVVLVGPVPQRDVDLPILAAEAWPNLPRFSKQELNDAVFAAERGLSAQRSKHLTYISLIAPMCRSTGCLTVAGRQLLFVDAGHLSPDGSRLVARIIAKRLQSSALAKPASPSQQGQRVAAGEVGGGR